MAGRVLSGISSQARRLGVNMEPLGFTQMHELVKMHKIAVTGPTDAVEKFAAYMRDMRYDERAESAVKPV